MAYVDWFFSIISFLTIGINVPNIPKKSKSFKNKIHDIADTSELWLETQRLSSNILKSLHPKETLKSTKKEIIDKAKLRYKKINKSIHTAHFMKTRDKFVFVFTLVCLASACYILGKYPCYFYIYYMVAVFVLIPMRFVSYRIQKYHYFLLDFCYYGNVICVAFLYFYPTNAVAFNISAAFALGPLLVAVPLFTNSFVPHSIDKITSLVIHLLPALAIWSIKSSECPAFTESMILLPFGEFYFYSASTYLAWILVYYFIMFRLAYERWQRKGNLTLYKWVMEDTTTLTYAYCGLLGERFRPLMFMSQHALSSLILIVVAYVQLVHIWVFTCSIIIITCWSFWNGAGYYIDLFASRYEKDIQKIEEIYQKLG